MNFILIILAAICFILAAVQMPKTSPIHLGWLGIFILTLTLIIK